MMEKEKKHYITPAFQYVSVNEEDIVTASPADWDLGEGDYGYGDIFGVIIG